MASLNPIEFTCVFHVTITNVNITQIQAMYAILLTYKEDSYDTDGFDFEVNLPRMRPFV